MELYLTQHAESKSKEEDPGRGLSDIGFENIRKVTRFAKKLNIGVETIFHSDKLRAKQTANELKQSINSVSGLKERDDIAPMDGIASMQEELSRSNKNVMVVGHLPYLDKLASALVCRDENKHVISFQYGCIVKLLRSNESNVWSIKWMIIPGIC